jgi:hypothetical protein
MAVEAKVAGEAAASLEHAAEAGNRGGLAGRRF